MSTQGSDLFTVDGYDFHDGIFTAHYTMVAGQEFTKLSERIDFGAVEAKFTPQPPLLRLLTLAASLSYYKATSVTKIKVNFGLTDIERFFFEQLIQNGLAEFAYRNDLPHKLVPEIIAGSHQTETVQRAWDTSGRPLVAVGGGKDSVVTIEALKAAEKDPLLFSVNQFDPIDRCVAVSGCDYVQVQRTLDPQLRAMNARGARNGHVPVTAINSIIGLVAADLAGLGPLVMSNESSASSGNLFWRDANIEVNHQWSKSLEFEDLLRSTLEGSGLEADRYFSLLRSLREIDIAERFAGYPQYFSGFTSCNRSFTLDPAERATAWCCECPKCLFVYLILAPFLPKSELGAIFGADLLDNTDNVALFEEILGIRGNKPFECVGEFAEAAEALSKLSQDPEWSSSAVVIALAHAELPVAPPETQIASRVPERFWEARNVTR